MKPDRATGHKYLTLPSDLIAAVSDFRHAARMRHEKDAYACLLRAGLAASTRKPRKSATPRRSPR